MTENQASRDGDQQSAKIAHEVAELLDRVAVRGPSFDDQMAMLRGLKAQWVDVGGGEEGVPLFALTEGTLGMVRASPLGDPMQATAYAALLRVKQQWRDLARGA